MLEWRHREYLRLHNVRVDAILTSPSSVSLSSSSSSSAAENVGVGDEEEEEEVDGFALVKAVEQTERALVQSAAQQVVNRL